MKTVCISLGLALFLCAQADAQGTRNRSKRLDSRQQQDSLRRNDNDPLRNDDGRRTPPYGDTTRAPQPNTPIQNQNNNGTDQPGNRTNTPGTNQQPTTPR